MEKNYAIKIFKITDLHLSLPLFTFLCYFDSVLIVYYLSLIISNPILYRWFNSIHILGGLLCPYYRVIWHLEAWKLMWCYILDQFSRPWSKIWLSFKFTSFMPKLQNKAEYRQKFDQNIIFSLETKKYGKIMYFDL